jgi:hypothetical protein
MSGEQSQELLFSLQWKGFSNNDDSGLTLNPNVILVHGIPAEK